MQPEASASSTAGIGLAMITAEINVSAAISKNYRCKAEAIGDQAGCQGTYCIADRATGVHAE
jgi:hypothetical protein